MLRIVKGKRRRLINGYGNCLGGGLRCVTRMNGQCLKFHFFSFLEIKFQGNDQIA